MCFAPPSRRGIALFYEKRSASFFIGLPVSSAPLFFFLTYIHTKAAKLLSFTSLLPCYSSNQKSIEYEKLTVNCSPRSFMNPFLSSLSSFLSSLKPSFSLLLLAPSSLIYYFSNLSLGFSSGPLPFSHFSPAPPSGIYSIPSGVLESVFTLKNGQQLFSLRLPNQVVLLENSRSLNLSQFGYLGHGTILSDGQTLKLLSWSTSKKLYPSSNSRTPTNPVLFKTSPIPFQSPPPPSFSPFKLNPSKGFFKFASFSQGPTSSSSYLSTGSLSSSTSLSHSSSHIIRFTPLSPNSIYTNVSISHDFSISSSTSFSPSLGFFCSFHTTTTRFGSLFLAHFPLFLPSSSLSLSGYFIPIPCSD